MAYLKNNALFFTTSPRTPAKMIPEIELLVNNFSNQKWNKAIQIQFAAKLEQADFFEDCLLEAITETAKTSNDENDWFEKIGMVVNNWPMRIIK